MKANFFFSPYRYNFKGKGIAYLLATFLSFFIMSFSYAQSYSYEYIGQVHNEVMDKMLATVEQGQAQGQSKTVILTSCYNSYVNHLASKFNKSNSDIETMLSGMGFSKSFNLKYLPDFDALAQAEIARKGDRDHELKLTQILGLIESVRDYNDLDNSLSAIEASSVGKSYEQDIRTVSAIARSSYQYWLENDGWDDNSKRRATREEREGIVGADVRSAIVGGGWGLITGGPAGGMVGACIGASYGSALAGIAVYFGWP